MLHKVDIDLFGTHLSIETGVMAKQADGAIIVRSGDNVVLVTACCSGKPRAGASFFPLTVDYREGTYAAGKFPGGFIKREERDAHLPPHRSPHSPPLPRGLPPRNADRRSRPLGRNRT